MFSPIIFTVDLTWSDGRTEKFNDVMEGGFGDGGIWYRRKGHSGQCIARCDIQLCRVTLNQAWNKLDEVEEKTDG